MKWHHRHPVREFFDRNDFQEYLGMNIGELLQEERIVLNKLRNTSDQHVKRYLENDLDTIQRAIREKQPVGSYRVKG